VRVYLDGSEAATSTTAVGAESTPTSWLFGRGQAGFSLQGRIDECALWDEALSADNVEWLSQHTLTDLVSVPASAMPLEPNYSWLFDEGSGTETVALTGDNNGTLVGSASWSNSAPFSYSGNYSVKLSGSDRVEASGHTVGTSGTISMWVNTTNTAIQYLLDSGAPRTLMYIELGGTGAEYTYINGVSIGAANWADTSTFTTGQWHHVVIVWKNADSPTKVRIYLDGVGVTASAAAAGAECTPTTWYFGGSWSNFKGLIDEYAFWDRDLSFYNVQWLFEHRLKEVIRVKGTVIAIN